MTTWAAARLRHFSRLRGVRWNFATSVVQHQRQGLRSPQLELRVDGDGTVSTKRRLELEASVMDIVRHTETSRRFESVLAAGTPSQRAGDPGDRDLPQPNPSIGKTIERLRQHIPGIVHTALPKDMLAADVVISLFPSQHPSIPEISGHIGYYALHRLLTMLAPIILARRLGEPIVLLPLAEHVEGVRRPTDGGGGGAGYGSRVSGALYKVKWEIDDTELDGDVDHGAAAAAATPEPAMSGWFFFNIGENGLIYRIVLENVDHKQGPVWDRRVRKLRDWVLAGNAPPPIPRVATQAGSKCG